MHEAYDPDAFVDLLDADALTGKHVEMLIRLRYMQMRPQAVTTTSWSCNG